MHPDTLNTTTKMNPEEWLTTSSGDVYYPGTMPNPKEPIPNQEIYCDGDPHLPRVEQEIEIGAPEETSESQKTSEVEEMSLLSPEDTSEVQKTSEVNPEAPRPARWRRMEGGVIFTYRGKKLLGITKVKQPKNYTEVPIPCYDSEEDSEGVDDDVEMESEYEDSEVDEETSVEIQNGKVCPTCGVRAPMRDLNL